MIVTAEKLIARAPAKKRSGKPGLSQFEHMESLMLNQPASGGYEGGYVTGEAVASALLKAMRADENGLAFLTMQSAIGRFMERIEAEGGQGMLNKALRHASPAELSRRGQYSGFFNTLRTFTSAASKQLGSRLDGFTDQGLIADAERGLHFDDVPAVCHAEGGAV